MSKIPSAEAIVIAAIVLVLGLAAGGWILFARSRATLKEEQRLRAQEAVSFVGKIKELEKRLGPILDMDKEIRRLNGQASSIESQIEALRSSYIQKKDVYDRLVSEVAIFDERLAFAEMGVYEPHFEFSDSEEYKEAIFEIRAKQKDMVTDKTAVVCSTEWQVDGSRAKGQTMTNRAIRLTLRAFNNECDAATANARWNNVKAMEKRIIKAKESIDKLNESSKVDVADDYLHLKLTELFLTHEHREKQKAEREERAEAARLAREEQKLIRDLERAEEEEERYARLLSKAQAEAASIVGPQLEVFDAQIKSLEKDLAEAHAKVERAQAMAEKTRSGYIYIISNIGSFGEDVVKIGLTRRLDPLDRIRELSDASVAFSFDIHAIIYSDEAPTLERALHHEFEPARINAMNARKEFFRAGLAEVEDAVRRLAPSAPFHRDIEAQDYRETLSKRSALLASEAAQEIAFPASI